MAATRRGRIVAKTPTDRLLTDRVPWLTRYENLTPWSYHEVSTAADGALSVFGIDLDGDGDVDVLSASESDGTIAWCVYVL